MTRWTEEEERIFQDHVRRVRIEVGLKADEHRPCCERAEDHERADPIRCVICRNDWPCRAVSE